MKLFAKLFPGKTHKLSAEDKLTLAIDQVTRSVKMFTDARDHLHDAKDYVLEAISEHDAEISRRQREKALAQSELIRVNGIIGKLSEFIGD